MTSNQSTTKSPTDFNEVLQKIDNRIFSTMELIESLGLRADDERHFLKVLDDLYHDIEIAMGVYDE